MEQDSNITVVRDLTSEQNTFKCMKRTKLKPECAIKSLEKKKAFLHDSYKANTKKKASVHDSYYADIESSQSAERQRTSRRIVLLKDRNTRTIQLPLRHLSERSQYWNDSTV